MMRFATINRSSNLNISDFLNKQRQIAIVGLGYVGLPLAEISGQKIQGGLISTSRIGP